MAPLVRSRSRSCTFRTMLYGLVCAALLAHLPPLLAVQRLLPLGPDFAVRGTTTHRAGVAEDSQGLELKSADDSLQDGLVVGRDLAGPVVEHVPPGRASRAAPDSSSDDIRKSAYVCEDGTLRLSCTAGKHIDVLRANFGRFSITLCNPSGFLDWSVNCASGNSLSVLTQRCSGQANCAVEASSSIFGPDPCPTTSKYLEVHYRCIRTPTSSSEQEIDSNRSSSAVADNGNALRSNSEAKAISPEQASPENSLSGQVLTPKQSSMGESALAKDNSAHKHGLNQDLLPTSNYLNTQCNQPDSESSGSSQFASAKCKQMDPLDYTRRHEGKTQGALSANQSRLVEANRDREPHRAVIAVSPTLTTQTHSASRDSINANLPDEGDVGSLMDEHQWPSTHSSFEAGLDSTCSAVTYRGIDWPPTVGGSVAIRPCPQDASGLAKWQCSANSRWSNLADLSRCRSRWMLELHSFQNVNNFRNDIWKSILTTLQQSSLYGADLVELNSLLHASLQNIFDTNQASVNLATVSWQPLSSLDALFETVSLLLSKDNAAWLDLPAFKREVTALDLLDIGAKYAALICLDARHSSSDKVIKKSQHLAVSCYSASKLLHSFQLSSQTRSNVSREFKLRLQPSTLHPPSMSMPNVTVSVVVSAANLTDILNEDVHFGSVLPGNLEDYFEVNANRTTLLSLDPGLDHLIELNRKRQKAFLNSNVVRLFVLKGSKMSQADYVYELEFRHHHSVSPASAECVHWDTNRNEWSNEQCTLLRSNETHSLCRCRAVSTCSLLAAEHSTNNDKSDASRYMQTHLWRKHKGNILSAALIAYMWLVLLLTRCHRSFFNDFNFIPMLVACALRTSIELCILSSTFWPEWAANWCQAMLFLALVQMQAISSLLLVFIFQNALLTVLASKIYLSKNYGTSLHALTKARQIQMTMAFVFAPIQLASLFSAAQQQQSACWPTSSEASFGLINTFLVLSPLLQLSTVVVAGFAFLHCSQKVFSEYGYPNLHCINLQTSLFEKHVKDVSRRRRRHGALWTTATCVYLFGVLISHCAGLAMANLSISLMGLDVGLSLAFLLFGRLKYVSAMAKCHHSTPTHCSSKDLSSSSSMRDNSISILSESSKTFLTLPGQISLAKMLDSPKIYPSPHRSSSTYGRNCNPSSHLYESPKHLYKYEYDRGYLYNVQNACPPVSTAVTTAYTAGSLTSRGNLYPLRVNSRLTHGPPLEPTSPSTDLSAAACGAADADCAMPIDAHFSTMARTNSMARAHGPAHAFRSRFFDRDNFISLS